MLVLCSVSLMGLRVATPLFVWSGSGLDFFVGFCLVGLTWCRQGVLVMALFMLSVAGARRIGFRWDPAVAWWEKGRVSLICLSHLAGPTQHSEAAILSAWRDKVSVDLCAWNGFR